MPVEIAHIDPWAKVKEHTFDNLIALCPTCHTRFDNGDIDRQSMLQYKANLSVINSRYGDIERKLLETLAGAPDNFALQMAGGMRIALKYLLQDKLIAEAPGPGEDTVMYLHPRAYYLTPKGHEFVDHWMNAQEL